MWPEEWRKECLLFVLCACSLLSTNIGRKFRGKELPLLGLQLTGRSARASCVSNSAMSRAGQVRPLFIPFQEIKWPHKPTPTHAR